MTRIRWTIALLGIAGLLALPAAAADRSGADTAAPGTITVTGTGTVTAAPEVSTWSFGVSGRADTAAAAFASASAELRKVIAALETENVAAADIQTQQIWLSTQLDRTGARPVGYQASGSVTVTVRRLDRAGAIVDAAVSAGASEIGGPGFSNADRDVLYRRALAAAVDDAAAKARVLAEKAGVTLGRLTNLTEQGAPGPIVYARGAAQSAPSDGVPIQPGQNEVTATVTATYAMS